MPPASTFRHPVPQSGTDAFRYRTGFSYSGTGLVPASAFLFIPVRTDWMPDADSLTFRHLKNGYILHVHTAGGGGCERDTQCTSKLQVVEGDTPCTFLEAADGVILAI